MRLSFSVKRQLKNYLRQSLDVALPLKYDLSKKSSGQGLDELYEKYLHVGQCLNVPQKKSDYFSMTPELVFQSKSKNKESSKGYYGLPTATEVGQDIVVQIPSNEIIRAIDVEKYFFSDDAAADVQVENGTHLNFILKQQFIEDFVNQNACRLFRVTDSLTLSQEENKAQSAQYEGEINYSANVSDGQEQRFYVVDYFMNQFQSLSGQKITYNYEELGSLDSKIKIDKKYRFNGILDHKGYALIQENEDTYVDEVFDTPSKKIYSLISKPHQIHKMLMPEQYDLYDELIKDISKYSIFHQGKFETPQIEFQYKMQNTTDKSVGMLLIYLRDYVEDYCDTLDIHYISEITKIIMLLLDLYSDPKLNSETQKAIKESLKLFLCLFK
ncbi:UNKNOWN [Stylonychia lemnae]|uniref:Uncharacterized protein n=1 Tax=Stylonychia lemnae TaxID=5949 RepID=A0A077ZV15_STYLE|nr:UNKNOWN [Stylonychia lemnae]|eukprot:CDW73729.1 UNKNOWN [Stylonychia lemnae]